MASTAECWQDGQTRVDSSCMGAPSVVFIERRLTLFVRQHGAGFGNLGAQFAQHGFSPAPQVLLDGLQQARSHLP